MKHRDFKLHLEQAANQVLHAITGGLILFVVFLSMLSHSYAEEPGAQESPKEWEELASIRLQAAIGHESRAEQKEALMNGTAGEALMGAGDEKVLASGNYNTATEHWKKAAKAYEVIGDAANVQRTQNNADTAWEAAKRTLREGADLHMRAAKQYGDANNLNEKIKALEKLASDLEAVMKME